MTTRAVAYYRTSSASNVGADKDSAQRQGDACIAYAKIHGLDLVTNFYDAAVSGADAVTERKGFMEMLAYCAEHDVSVILVENASRFARDLIVQLTGHELLKQRGIDLIPVDAPDYFLDDTPTAKMIRQILGAVAEFEKSALVRKLKVARDRKREKTGRCEGRPPAPEAHREYARKLKELNPSATLRTIAGELAHREFLSPSGRVYSPSSIKAMLK